MLHFEVIDSTGYYAGASNVVVYGSNGKVKYAGGSTPGSAAWGSIGPGTGVASQADLVAYLNANYYPLLTNPAGYLTSVDLAPYLTIASAAATYVPLTRTLTINGVTYDLSADRSWVISGSGVTNVTATLPITSSGGATPDISTSMNTNKLIGRYSAGVGVMEEVSIGAGLSLSAGTLSATPGVFTSSIGVDTNDLNASIDSNGVLIITPTTNLKITGLQGGSSGRDITLVNGASNYTLFIEHNSSSSSASNRIYNPDRNFIVLLPGEVLRMVYRGDLSLWYTDRVGLGNQYDTFSDFLIAGVSGNSGNLDCWAQLGAGTPNTAAFSLRNGVLGMTLPATAGNYIHVGTATSTTTSMGDAVAGVSRLMCSRVAIAQLPVITTRDYELKIGFLLAKNASYLANAGAFWYLDRNFANWQCVTAPSAAGQTLVDSGIVATAGTGASNFLHLGVVQLVGPSGGSVVANCCFYAVDQNGVITFGSRLQTTNLPAQGYDVSADLYRVATGSSGNMLYIDYLGYKTNGVR